MRVMLAVGAPSISLQPASFVNNLVLRGTITSLLNNSKAGMLYNEVCKTSTLQSWIKINKWYI